MSRLYGANGGWAATRTIKYEGLRQLHEMPYHVISPIISMDEWYILVEWCVDTFGASGTDDLPGIWSKQQRWYVNSSRFWFRDESDRDLFLLKWA